MGFLNIEKNNSNNNQNSYFNQNPNMMANNQYSNNMYNNQGMQSPMQNQQMSMNYGNQYPNQGMMPNMQQQPVMQQPVQQQYYQYPQNSEPQMSRYVEPVQTNEPHVSSYIGSESNVNNQVVDRQPSLADETKNTLNYYNEKIEEQERIAEQKRIAELEKASLDVESLKAQEIIETLDDEMQLPRETEEKSSELDPLNNGSNPVPVNPIAATMEKYQDVEDIGEQKDAKANIFAAFGIIFGMLIKPGTTMLKNAKKFKKLNKAFMIMLWLSLIFLIVCIAVRVVVGSFDRTYSSLTDSYRIVFNPARLFELSNYLEYILITACVCVGGVLLVALIYYASSFLNSKGVHFATYLIVSNLGLIPLIVGSIVLYPIGVLLSGYIGIGVLIFSFLATIITLLIGMNEVLKFDSVNNQIFYHVINLSVITLIAIMIFVFMLHQNWIILPQINI